MNKTFYDPSGTGYFPNITGFDAIGILVYEEYKCLYYTNEGEVGKNSFCHLKTSLGKTSPICINTKCLDNGSLLLTYKKNSGVCNYKGQSVQLGMSDVIQCSNPIHICGIIYYEKYANNSDFFNDENEINFPIATETNSTEEVSAWNRYINFIGNVYVAYLIIIVGGLIIIFVLFALYSKLCHNSRSSQSGYSNQGSRKKRKRYLKPITNDLI